jgi:hypothetical protein
MTTSTRRVRWTKASSTEPVSHRIRLSICVVASLLAAHYVYFLATHKPLHRDLGQLWFAAGEVLGGRNPYLSIGPGRAYDWPWPLYYPLPAVIACIPLRLMSEPVAMAAFAGVSIGIFGWALGERGYPALLALASFTTWHAVTLVQLSPLIASALVLAPVSALLVMKPTSGAAVFVARPTWWPVVAGAVLIAVSFLLQPHWVQDWLAALDSPNVAPGFHSGHYAIVQFPGGILVLTALARWRRPEARLLVALACVPQTLLPYEAVLLFLIPRGWLECAAMLVLSYVMFFVAIRGGSTTFAVRTLTLGPAVTWTMYLPATLMVLRRANEGAIPDWLEQRFENWPAWLRGRREASTQ